MSEGAFHDALRGRLLPVAPDGGRAVLAARGALMEQIEQVGLIVVLGVVLVGGSVLADRIHVPLALVLFACGAALSYLPWLGSIRLAPNLVLFFFLPALLYWDSINTSLREIRSNLRVIVLSGVGLVFATAFAVGALVVALGFSWPVALILGAVLAPTDATAAASAVRRLPRRSGTTLNTESLINDATALTLYGVAVTAATTGAGLSAAGVVGRLFLSAVIAIAVGLVTGFVALWVRRFLPDSRAQNAVSLVTPFVAFLPAQAAHASGVLAVVTCGLVVVYGGKQQFPWISVNFSDAGRMLGPVELSGWAWGEGGC